MKLAAPRTSTKWEDKTSRRGKPTVGNYCTPMRTAILELLLEFLHFLKKTPNIYYYIVSGQKCWRSLTGYFWLRVCHKRAVKWMSKATVIWILTGPGESTPKAARSHGCWQEALVRHHVGFSMGPLTGRGSWLPHSEWSEGGQGCRESELRQEPQSFAT